MINDGKWNILTFKILRHKLEVDFWITQDCSNSLSNKCRLIFRIWRQSYKHFFTWKDPYEYLWGELVAKKEFNFFKLRYKIL